MDLNQLQLAYHRARIDCQVASRWSARKAKIMLRANEQLKKASERAKEAERTMLDLEMQLFEAKGKIKKVGVRVPVTGTVKIETEEQVSQALKGMSKDALQALFANLAKGA